MPSEGLRKIFTPANAYAQVQEQFDSCNLMLSQQPFDLLKGSITTDQLFWQTKICLNNISIQQYLDGFDKMPQFNNYDKGKMQHTIQQL